MEIKLIVNYRLLHIKKAAPHILNQENIKNTFYKYEKNG